MCVYVYVYFDYIFDHPKRNHIRDQRKNLIRKIALANPLYAAISLSGLPYFSSTKKSKRVHTSSTQKSTPSTNFLGVLDVLFVLENWAKVYLANPHSVIHPIHPSIHPFSIHNFYVIHPFIYMYTCI
jgi:hypothetical protein